MQDPLPQETALESHIQETAFGSLSCSSDPKPQDCSDITKWKVVVLPIATKDCILWWFSSLNSHEPRMNT